MQKGLKIIFFQPQFKNRVKYFDFLNHTNLYDTKLYDTEMFYVERFAGTDFLLKGLTDTPI